MLRKRVLCFVVQLAFAVGGATPAASAEDFDENAPLWPPAPRNQSPAESHAKTAGCMSCHLSTDQKTMHRDESIVLGCADCHGGDASVFAAPGLDLSNPEYIALKERAHVQPRFPEAWGLEDGVAGVPPIRTYTLFNRESPDYIRFRNPGDYRVVDEACGACHAEYIEAAKRSLMSTGAMFWNGAAYNNGIIPNKQSAVGEYYTREGEAAALRLPAGETLTPEQLRKGVIPGLSPIPRYQTTPPGDNYRIFERGGELNGNLFPEIGNPNLGLELQVPGRPDVRQSKRGLGTGGRISVPVLNLHKTRLNDPFMWFEGTNDNPGDFRGSGCTGCHVIYANDREPIHSGPYSEYGHWGQTATVDPTIASRLGPDGQPEHGHAIRHEFTTAIPTSQCMVCHMHQPNEFVNSYLGFTMWDYESDAPLMWPQEQRFPTAEETVETLKRNPEAAAARGKWSDVDFLSSVWTDVNPQAEFTQFADYHGHGWNFRGVYKRARDGTMLDAEGEALSPDLSNDEKWEHAVLLRDIHADYGMQCADCHFSVDSHGNGLLYGEVSAGIEIRCRDCHGTYDEASTLRTSGPAAPPGGSDMSLFRNSDGRRRFEWREGTLYQRLILPPHDELAVTQIVDTLDPDNHDYNPKAARAKTVSSENPDLWGESADDCDRAHDEDEVSCFSCHSSWVTSCAGCHLPIEANWNSEDHHFEGDASRNFASYNPQVARSDMFQLGRHSTVKGHIIAPVRSSSALVASSTDSSRQRIYVQQPPVSSAGFSSQAFAPHFPHTVRKTETKECEDCHVSEENDNNAIMSQLLLLGTNFVNFMGYHAYVGRESGVEAVQVGEWTEPQAVIGSYLHRYAYPQWYEEHLDRDRELLESKPIALEFESPVIGSLRRGLTRLLRKTPAGDGGLSQGSGRVACLQLRGEYLLASEGADGTQAYDVSAIGNKGFSEKLITAPFSPLGQNLRIKSRNATCVAIPTNQPIRPERNRAHGAANQEQPMHPIYSYGAITDSEEGLILFDTETLGDFEPRNNFFERALTWNPKGILDGANYLTFAGHILYVSADRGVAVVDLDDPLSPKLLALVPIEGAKGLAVQFRYLFVAGSRGLEVVDVTSPDRPRHLADSVLPIEGAKRVFVSRTYAYLAAGTRGLVIADIERPEAPRHHITFSDGGRLNDVQDVAVATSYASLFAYVADGKNGLKVLQLTSPEIQPKYYGFSPVPKPTLIAHRKTGSPALALSRALERDRAVDETGHQVAVMGRVGSRPFTLEEMKRLYLDAEGKLMKVSNDPDVRTGRGASCDPPPESR